MTVMSWCLNRYISLCFHPLRMYVYIEGERESIEVQLVWLTKSHNPISKWYSKSFIHLWEDNLIWNIWKTKSLSSNETDTCISNHRLYGSVSWLNWVTDGYNMTLHWRHISGIEYQLADNSAVCSTEYSVNTKRTHQRSPLLAFC